MSSVVDAVVFEGAFEVVEGGVFLDQAAGGGFGFLAAADAGEGFGDVFEELRGGGVGIGGPPVDQGFDFGDRRVRVVGDSVQVLASAGRGGFGFGLLSLLR